MMVTEKSDTELLHTLVSSPRKVEDVLAHYEHNPFLLTRATFSDLVGLGLTPKEANRILAALELFKRAYTNPKVNVIKSSQDAFLHFKDLGFSATEIFAVLFLDRANKVITYKRLFQGGITETSVDIRIILKMAIGVGATGIICGHNHPSGNRLASNADILLCKDIGEACRLLQIQLVDNLIITHNAYLSFQDEGML
jgi:DNA repair protein RadC